MAIAGTQKKWWFRWGNLAEKEMEEQQFVTDFILNNLKSDFWYLALFP
jgi:hypothetical protein